MSAQRRGRHLGVRADRRGTGGLCQLRHGSRHDGRAAGARGHRTHRIARFTGSYHGHSDTTLIKAKRDSLYGAPIAPGVPNPVADITMVLDYGSPAALETIRQQADRLAAVVVEPVQSRRPGLQPAEFLRDLREITREAGCALIFDETITGFRLAPGGAQEFFGVRADLCTYGKVAGGGMPIGIIAGTSRFMDAIDGGLWSFGDDTGPRSVATFFAGTFSGHPLAMAACVAVLRHVRERGPQLHAELNARTERLAQALNRHFETHAYPIWVNRAGSLFRFVFFENYSCRVPADRGQPVLLQPRAAWGICLGRPHLLPERRAHRRGCRRHRRRRGSGDRGHARRRLLRVAARRGLHREPRATRRLGPDRRASGDSGRAAQRGNAHGAAE